MAPSTMAAKHIQAIPTRFMGINFRSRLEARWAVLFQYATLPWSYEPVTFQLAAGYNYTVDFKVNGNFLEVKPKKPNPAFMSLLGSVSKYIDRNYNASALFLGYGNFYQEEVPRVLHLGTNRHCKTLEKFLMFLGWSEDSTIIHPRIMASNFRFDL